ncbi:uncharacterized protein PRCAT00003331001 [Priceomyces carsonii]|uniref:uncharacterized protein n=1 Tax=Priceomyces carsonii TaxID=28549 RepID=UPI002ED8C414|nr:unnamed protein product [Priceomyces carsonii]
MANITQTCLIPGEGIGNSLRLGQTMYSVVKRFDRFNYKMIISYSEEDYLNTPIIVHLPTLGIRLLFENSGSQNLLLIELLSFEHLKIFYNGLALNDISVSSQDNTFVGGQDNSSQSRNSLISAEERLLNEIEAIKKVTPPTLKLIYNKIFGPTYPGKLCKESKYYILSYPGVSFKFKIKLPELSQRISKVSSNENQILSKLLNWDRSEDVSAESISVFEGNSWDDFHSKLKTGQAKVENNDNIKKLKINLRLGTIRICFENGREFLLELGKTTQQAVLNVLGPPEDYFNKFDSRLLIHNHLSKSFNLSDATSNSSVWKFHNYFGYGLDFLYDLNDASSAHETGILKKVIIHNGGIAESLDFMKWNRCNWELIDDTSDDFGKIDSTMYFSDIQDFFSRKNTSPSSARPVLLNRNESEFIDNDLDIINLDEVDSNNSLSEQKSASSSSINSNSRIKTWGQSKLYGCDRCIWEVIDSNGCISSVTIY